MRITLASSSPRRKELLKKLFQDFEILPAKGEESATSKNPEEIVLELSRQKAEEIQSLIPDSTDYLIIGADTVVSLEGNVLGKPADEKDAEKTLAMLSGKVHQVYTGVTLLFFQNGIHKSISFAECTHVTFYPITAAEISAYVRSGEPMDKAGSYGIQGNGGRFIERIEGSYENVVGLPSARIYQVLKKIGDFALRF